MIYRVRIVFPSQPTIIIDFKTREEAEHAVTSNSYEWFHKTVSDVDWYQRGTDSVATLQELPA